MLNHDLGVVIFSCRLTELRHFYTSETNIKSVFPNEEYQGYKPTICLKLLLFFITSDTVNTLQYLFIRYNIALIWVYTVSSGISL